VRRGTWRLMGEKVDGVWRLPKRLRMADEGVVPRAQPGP
jgi:hypothetical protein